LAGNFTYHFTIDDESGQVTVIFEPAPGGVGQATQSSVQLKEGQSFKVSAAGQGENQILVTLFLSTFAGIFKPLSAAKFFSRKHFLE
jgi:hypothetical protein